MCRNDDFNLVVSTLTKRSGASAKKKLENKDKMIADLRMREDDRQLRENEIMKELSNVNKNYATVDKHLRKMIRKALVLTVDPVLSQIREQ